MKSVIMRITLFAIFLFCLVISSAYSAAERRTALVIGNGDYETGRLRNPVNDATDMAATLKRLGFNVILKTNAKQREMDEAVREFGRSLIRSDVGLFFFAGHGIQVSGSNYLIPVGASIEKEEDVRFEAIDVGRIMAEMDHANNGLNIVLLDACRNNPFARNFRSDSRGLAIISQVPRGAFISYATAPGDVARDGEGRNSPYTGALLQQMQTPGVPIETVFKRVRQKLDSETGGKQVPWESSSLKGDFFFIPQESSQNNLPDTSSSARTQSESDELARQKEALKRERQELARAKQELERQKALDAEREQLAAERRKIEAERQQLAMGKRPSVSTAGETARDGRFIAYDNGTVLDTKTNLMWAAKDNGSSINWANAKSYCENYRGGGYTDWRMPTQDELAGLYDAGKTYKSECLRVFWTYDIHLTELIHLTCISLWASETRSSDAATFYFGGGNRWWFLQSSYDDFRALPVRSAK